MIEGGGIASALFLSTSIRKSWFSVFIYRESFIRIQNAVICITGLPVWSVEGLQPEVFHRLLLQSASSLPLVPSDALNYTVCLYFCPLFQIVIINLWCRPILTLCRCYSSKKIHIQLSKSEAGSIWLCLLPSYDKAELYSTEVGSCGDIQLTPDHLQNRWETVRNGRRSDQAPGRGTKSIGSAILL
jgi:hypothetical protein